MMDDEEFEYFQDWVSDRSRTSDSDSDGELDDSREEVPLESGDQGQIVEGSDQSAGVLRMCDDHPPGSMTKACGICAAALDLVRPEVAKSWLAPVIVAKAAVARYAVRSDEKPPTLMFSESTLDLAVNTLTQGKFKNNSHFQELTRNYGY